MLGILLLASAVFGQTSLFDMKYGDSYSQTIARLKSKGFVEVDHSDKHYHLSGGAKSMLPEIMVYLSIDGKSVFSWKVTYDLKSDPAAEKKVIASLVDLHGKYSVKDDYDYNYIWYFPNNKALYVDVYNGDSILLDYTTGNLDDDDLYYYYYEEY